MNATTALPIATASSRATRFMRSLPLRMILALLCVILPFLLSRIAMARLPPLPLWTQLGNLLSAAVALGAYVLYVRRGEQRAVAELAPAGAARRLGLGALGGGALFSGTIGLLYLAGSYRITAVADWTVIASPLMLAFSVALLEEILLRGILFRMLQQSLGSWIAMLASAAVFGLAHLSNDEATLMGAASAFLAGLMFAAAYLLTGTLWTSIGLHIGWNFFQGGIFSVAVSGHASKGLLQGRLLGPDWLSGGNYGAEGSLVALLVMAAVIAAMVWIIRRDATVVLPYWKRHTASQA